MKRARLLCMILAVTLTMSGCAKRRPAVLPPPPETTAPPTDTVVNDTGNAFLVHVAYATDRAPGPVAGKLQTFLGTRSDLRYGHATVSIPRTHEAGEVELPSWFRLQFEPDPAKHFTVAQSELLTPAAWSADVQARLRHSKRKAALLFIHGYNVSFADALFRTAQIEHDTTFPGPAVLFSWPSKAKTIGYTKDEEDVQWAIPHLTEVIRRLLAIGDTNEIFIIAHSMGNRVLVNTLAELGRTSPAARAKIKEVVLAAPDIDAGIFKRDIAPKLPAAAQRITVYASSRDMALAASAKVHGYGRLGDTKPSVTIAPPLQTIDASALPADMLGHSYIGDNLSVLEDVRKIFASGAAPAQRGLRAAGPASKRYWRFDVPKH